MNTIIFAVGLLALSGEANASRGTSLTVRTAAEGLRAARALRDKLVAQLPRPTKIKLRDVRNTTGVIGVARVKERTRSGKVLVRCVASWPKRNGERGKASFSVGLYGENEAFRLAVSARRAALQELKLAK